MRYTYKTALKACRFILVPFIYKRETERKFFMNYTAEETSNRIRRDTVRFRFLTRKKMMLEFFIDMIPPTATHQERGCVIKNGKRQYYNRNNGEAEQKLTAYLSRYIPEEPFTGALQVIVKWCFPIKGKHKDGEPHTNKPDADNLCKALYDIMTKLGYWKDDSHIYSSITEKFWAQRPGLYIRIKEK